MQIIMQGFYISNTRHTHTHTEKKKKNAQDDVTVWMMLPCLWEVRKEKKKKRNESQSEEIKQINMTERVSGDLVYLGSRWLL